MQVDTAPAEQAESLTEQGRALAAAGEVGPGSPVLSDILAGVAVIALPGPGQAPQGLTAGAAAV